MNIVVLKSHLLLLLYTFGVFAAGPVVRIGDQDYTKNDLISQLNNSDQDPMEAVNQIKRSKALKIITKSEKSNSKNAEMVAYKNLFGVSIEDDILVLNDHILPAVKKKEARLRMMLFDRKIVEMADEMVPVSFLDEKGFWELVKNCKSYQIRKKHGFETPMSNWEYTWNELLVNPEMVVATKNGACFLNGSELNIWIKENYSRGLRTYVKRKHSKDEIVDILSKKAVHGKLMAQKIGDKKLLVRNNYIERAVDNFIKENMMISDFSIKDCKGKTFSDVNEFIYNKYREKSAAKLTKLRKMLKGENKLQTIDSKESVYCTNTAVGSMQMEITSSVEDSEIYNWIKERHFKGSLNEARQALGLEKYKIVIDKEISKEGIAINSLKK